MKLLTIKRNFVSFLALCSFSLFVFGGCSNKFNKEEAVFVDFGSNGMTPGYSYLLQPENLADSASSKHATFNLSVLVRYTENCNLKELPLTLEFLPNIHDSIDNREIAVPLFDNTDNRFGSGNFTLYETEFPLAENISIDDSTYLTASTTEKDTQGIKAIGLIIRSLN